MLACTREVPIERIGGIGSSVSLPDRTWRDVIDKFHVAHGEDPDDPLDNMNPRYNDTLELSSQDDVREAMRRA